MKKAQKPVIGIGTLLVLCDVTVCLVVSILRDCVFVRLPDDRLGRICQFDVEHLVYENMHS